MGVNMLRNNVTGKPFLCFKGVSIRRNDRYLKIKI